MHATPFDPWAWVKETSGALVRVARLAENRMGHYDPETAEIVLDDRLTSVEERCTLVHEGVHALRDDHCLAGLGLDGDRLERRQERDVHRLASRLVLDDVDVLAGALARTMSLAEAAEELGVDEDTLWTRLQALDSDETLVLQRRIELIEEQSWPT